MSKFRHRIRETIFSPVDEAVFSEALRLQFPTVIFVDRAQWKGPGYPAYRSIAECSDRRKILILAPEGNWNASIIPLSSNPGWFRFSWYPAREVQFVLSQWDWGPPYLRPKWAWDPPTLGEGWITGGFRQEDRQQAAFIRQVWRIIERVATNRFNAGHPLGNALTDTDRCLMADSKGGMVWIGHHALEWCAAAPRRMLDGKFRPCDDWRPPEDDWYRSLRQEVIRRYGPSLGEPPDLP